MGLVVSELSRASTWKQDKFPKIGVDVIHNQNCLEVVIGFTLGIITVIMSKKIF